MHKENMQALKDTLELDALSGGEPYETAYVHMDFYIEWVEAIKYTYNDVAEKYGFKEAMLSMIILNNGLYYIN